MYRIIVADDEIMARERMVRFVEDIPEVKVVASLRNGMQVREYLEKNRANMVITDIRMPLMNGLELAEYIYKEHPSCQVVLISAYDEFDYARKAINYGVKSFLVKPIVQQELSELISSLYQRQIKEKKTRLFMEDIAGNFYIQQIREWLEGKRSKVPEFAVNKKVILYTVKMEEACSYNKIMIQTALGNILQWLSAKCIPYFLGVFGNEYHYAVLYEYEGMLPGVAELEEIIEKLVGVNSEVTCTQKLDSLYMLKKNEEDDIVIKAKTYIISHIKESISREMVAEAVHMDPSYFSRYFKKKTGKSFQDFVFEIRMEKAKQLLAEGWRVKDVCNYIGYRDRNYFNKMFREYTGYNPSDYRRNSEEDR